MPVLLYPNWNVNNNLFYVPIDSMSPDQSPVSTPDMLQEVKGVFCSDIVIRHAIMTGLQDLRDNPWQLSLVFASLLDDTLTNSLYGQKEVVKAVNWFLKTNVPVIMDYSLTGSPAMPCVTVGLQDSTEAEATLGDTHYVPSESTPAVWEPVGQKFTASYNPTTGLITPDVAVVVNDQMVMVDGNGINHTVLSTVVDSNGNENFLIEKGLVTNFNNCVLKWSTNKLKVNLESCNFREAYTIGCHVKGDTNFLLYLWAIVVYSLMRYKKSLLEGRGFERSVIASTKVMPNTSLAPTGSENCWSRFITITGYCKMYWATTVSEKVTKATFASALSSDGSRVSQPGFIPDSFTVEPGEDPTWLTGDGIGVPL